VCACSDYLSDDDHRATTGSAFIRKFIPGMCSVHFFVFFSFLKVSFLKSEI
jgi:hypothetical protein